jgi:4-amino-4-deoxy-L-arabinose transferase-like glycosyltransferase
MINSSESSIATLSLPRPCLKRRPDSYRFLFASIVLAALVFRAWKFFLLGLDHYDEGIYALSGFWSLHSYAGHAMYPFQKLFSPPGYFGLIGLAYRIAGGASDSAAIGINVLVGGLSVALAGWIGSRWFGRSCGVAVAVLVALSDFNITFDRTALTDTVFTFLFLLSLALIAIALEKSSLKWALLAGVAGGVAWNVKYDGWLPAAIAFAGIIVLAAAKKESLDSVKRKLLLWGPIGGVTLILFLPWVIYTQERMGGYFAVESFHGTFLNFRLAENFLRQAESQIYFDGFLSHIAPVLALLVALVTDEGHAFARWRYVGLVVGGVVVSVVLLGGTGTCIALAVTGFYAAWRRDGILGTLLISGIGVLLVLIPCYTPFARLVLPWMMLVQILAGVGIQRIVRLAESFPSLSTGAEDESRTGGRISWALCLAGLAVILLTSRSAATKTDPWNAAATNSVRQAVARMTTMIPRGSVVFVEEEPDAAFYFRRAGYDPFCVMRLLANKDFPGVFNYSIPAPFYLVAGTYAQLLPDWHSVPPEIRSRIVLVARLTIHPGDVRLLDDLGPEQAIQYRSHPDDTYNLLLLRVNPSQPSAATLNSP